MGTGNVGTHPSPDSLGNVIKKDKGKVGTHIGMKWIDPPIVYVLKLDMFFNRAKVPSNK